MGGEGGHARAVGIELRIQRVEVPAVVCEGLGNGVAAFFESGLFAEPVDIVEEAEGIVHSGKNIVAHRNSILKQAGRSFDKPGTPAVHNGTGTGIANGTIVSSIPAPKHFFDVVGGARGNIRPDAGTAVGQPNASPLKRTRAASINGPTKAASDAAAPSAGLGFRVRRGCLVDFLVAGGRHGSGKPERIHAEVSRLCPRLLPHVEYSVSHAFPSYEAYRPSPAETPDASRL